MKKHDLSFVAVIATLTLYVAPTSSIAQAPANPPIHFYGRAVDQNGEPVGNAKVTLDVVTTRLGGYGDDSKPMTLQTGQDGKFQVTGVTGYSLDNIWIEKEGYQLSPKTIRSYLFGIHPDYKPDPANPVVFKMWQLAGKEPLVGSAWHGRIPGDGGVERFDLNTGKQSANGELEITCTRSPLNSPPPGNGHFDYKFQIAVVGGGIQPTDDEFDYRTPENGYLPSFTFGQKTDDPKWDVRIPIPKDYYIKTADGHYGRLHVEWYAAQGSPAHLEWDCSINPSGSRNLER
jgi:hypothetical protein